MVVTHTPKAIKPTEEASARTVQQRTKFVKYQIDTVSCHSVLAQTGAILKSFTSTERKSILDLGNIAESWIDAEEVVAMKASLNLPWSKIKAMARYDTEGLYYSLTRL